LRRTLALPRGRAYLWAMEALFNFLIPISILIVFLILCFGIYTLFRGGDFGRSWSNKAMRARVLMQFVAVVILLAALLVHKAMRSG
jgi:hypothetical protein